jgi:mono/diheme cytochrome c family protein
MSSHFSESERSSTPESEARRKAIETEFGTPNTGDGTPPKWLWTLLLIGLFWAGAYLFSYSGGFAANVFDYEPKFGAAAGGPAAPADPKVVGKALFSANCVTCHQATGQGVAGQYPPLAGSEFVNGEASNRLIAIVLKGLQGAVQVKGQSYNNAMQAWEGQYSDQQLASILTYVRSDWGNSAPPISADAVKQLRDELKDRKEQWTYPELMKIPPKDVAGGGGKPPAPGQAAAGQAPAGGQPPAGQSSPAAPATGGQPPAPAGAGPSPASAPPAASATPAHP